MSEHEIQPFLQTQGKKCLIFFLQDQCLPSAASALAEQVGSFELFGLFVCFVGWLACSVRCLVGQVGFFDLVGLLLKSVIRNKNNLKIFDLFIQRFVVEDQNQKVYLKYLDIEKSVNQIFQYLPIKLPSHTEFPS